MIKFNLTKTNIYTNYRMLYLNTEGHSVIEDERVKNDGADQTTKKLH